MSEIRTLNEIGPGDRDVVGGKALSLAVLAAAGLPVPPGFCVTTSAYRRLEGAPPAADAALRAHIAEAYRQLGGGLVAVRSSATSEDTATSSFAGQQQTVLGVDGVQAVLEAIGQCWASLHNERARAYRQRQGIGENGLAMAVVVQRLVPAEVAGVLFTRDPLDPEGRRMLVEASWGLGESVVAGQVMPDRFHLDRESGIVLDRQISPKLRQLTSTGPEPVPPEQQNRACLDDARLAELAALGRRVEAVYGDPRDVEWAWADGRFWLLQARPITAGGAAEREQVRHEEIAALTKLAEPDGTVWSRYNVAEVLAEPTPMTWSLVRRLLSGRGGLGLMYRDLGFEPDPALDEIGIYDLVCGRPYCNLNREPRMQHGRLPLEHSFASLKADPLKALYPRATLNPARADWRFWLSLPMILWQLYRSARRVNRLSRTFAERLRREQLPAFARETAREASEDLTALQTSALLERLEYWTQRTLYDFARDSLKPTVLAAVALDKLQQALIPSLGPERVPAVLGELTLGVRPDAEADLAAAVRELAAGKLDCDTFLQRCGHRGSQEMELAQPRWSEEPAALDRLLVRDVRPANSQAESTATVWARVAAEARLPFFRRSALEGEVRTLQTYLGLRETAKHYFMMGYAMIRRVLVEVDRRYRLAGGIFYLTPEELPRLAAGADLSSVIAQRRRRRAMALSLEVPQVLFSDSLDAIGRPTVVPGASVLQGTPLSAGVAEGEALVLHEPTAAAAAGQEAYVLVCPSTDPAWVPLFLRARALVMEMGGVLSHGAIVAREFGLPAVAGLPDIHRRLQSRQRLRVDGAAGTVTLLPSQPSSSR